MNYLHDPKAIEAKSFEMIGQELGGRTFGERMDKVIKRVIHTTADFEYADILEFSENAIDAGLSAMRKGCSIFTDTKMAYSGINKTTAEKKGVQVDCYIADDEIARIAKERGITRAMASMEAAAEKSPEGIYVIGNAPTALFRIKELVDEGKLKPALIIGVPVGFVNVVESKEAVRELGIPYIISRGRKGGSTVAAAIVNALLYMEEV